MILREIIDFADSTIPPTIIEKLSGGAGDSETAKTNIIYWLLYAAGLLAVVMIIVGGVKMTTSAGNSAAVQKAKQTILYSIIGLVVVVLAYAIVKFVIGVV